MIYDYMTSLGLTATLAILIAIPCQSRADFVEDGVIASIDGKALTLSDLTSRLTPKRKLTLVEATKDPAAKKVLDDLILEALVAAEAETRKVSVTDAELEGYIKEVSKRNGMDRAQFEAALLKEGNTLAVYKVQIESEILRSKLVGTMLQGSISVSDSEIEDYLATHPQFAVDTGATVKLRRILISSERSSEELIERTKLVKSGLDSGIDFAELAKQYSDAPEAKDGGELGVMKVAGLHPDLQAAVAKTERGKSTTSLVTSEGLQFFLVQEKIDSSETSASDIKGKVKQMLHRAKLEQKAGTYFDQELPKLHAVERVF